MSRKHILILSWFYLPFTGGAELFVRAVTDRLQDRYDFTILTARLSRTLPKRESYGNVTLIRTGLGFPLDKVLYPIWAFFVALRLIGRVDAIHAIMVNATTLVSRALSWCRPRPSILTLQIGDDEAYVRNYLGLWYPLYPYLHRGFTRVHAISRFLRSQAIERGVAEDSIAVIPNGVDLTKFHRGVPGTNASSEQENLRTELRLVDKRVVMSISRLAQKNGIDTLINALPSILAKAPDAVLVLVGDGEERTRLVSQAENLGIQDRVLFMGHIPHEDTPRYLGIADVFARPSNSEGLGTAFLEAMACGVPIVGTPVGGIPDFLEHDETGLLCPPADAQALADAVSRLFADADLHSRLTDNAHKLIEQSYSWDYVSEALGEIYGELV